MSNPRKVVKVPIIPRIPMNNDTPSLGYDKDADRDRNYMFYVVSQATQVVQSSNSSGSVRQLK